MAAARRGEPIALISHGAQVDINQYLVRGSVTVIDFYADWCGPCRQLSPSLEQMARNDPEIALRKIDIVNWKTAVAQQFNIHSIPQVNVYDRSGRLVGTVLGVDFEKVKNHPDLSVIGHMTAKEKGAILITKGNNIHPLVAQGWNAFREN